jgi:rieske iron-sulfur protein
VSENHEDVSESKKEKSKESSEAAVEPSKQEENKIADLGAVVPVKNEFSAPSKQIGAPTNVTRAAESRATRPTIGKPSASTAAKIPLEAQSIAQRNVVPDGAPNTRPSAVLSPKAVKPFIPPKHLEPEISRRNFLKAIAILGGIVAVAQFVPVALSYANGSTEGSSTPKQIINDSTTGAPIKTSDISVNNWKTFVYPRTGNPNIDNDTFRQQVVIHLPKDLTAPSNLSIKDPLSGDLFIAFSRVCVHLWCLWSYVPVDRRMECPCHGSQYVPGSGPYPNFLAASYKPPGDAVAGPASLQTPPNNMLPIITLAVSSDGTLSATGIIGQIGCGQKC